MDALCGCFKEAAGKGWAVVRYDHAERLISDAAQGERFNLAALDFFRGDGNLDGESVLAKLHAASPELPIVAVAEQGTVETAASAVRAGAMDFLVRGQRLDERVSTLLNKARKVMALVEQNRALREQNLNLRESDTARFQIVGESPQVKELLARIKRVARIPRPVLIVGERGTGKELVARAIHDASDRAERPLIVANCAALPDALLESELFGHERGAFTGADSLRRGKFEMADGGTLFLDEIGHMSLPFQQKILRVVEYRTFTRVGGAEELRTDARVIAATNADLEERMQQGKFLRDLYDRLAFETIRVPPLRERRGDIEILARHFLNEFMQEIPSLSGKTFGQEAVDVLKEYSFPGNVRELKNIIERAAYRDTTNEINPEDIGMLPKTASDSDTGGDFRERMDAFERSLITDALKKTNGNQAAAARLLGLSYHQFRYFKGKHEE